MSVKDDAKLFFTQLISGTSSRSRRLTRNIIGLFSAQYKPFSFDSPFEKPAVDSELLSHLVHLRLRLLQPSVAGEVWGWGRRAPLSLWTPSWSTCFWGGPAPKHKNVRYSISTVSKARGESTASSSLDDVLGYFVTWINCRCSLGVRLLLGRSAIVPCFLHLWITALTVVCWSPRALWLCHSFQNDRFHSLFFVISLDRDLVSLFTWSDGFCESDFLISQMWWKSSLGVACGIELGFTLFDKWRQLLFPHAVR